MFFFKYLNESGRLVFVEITVSRSGIVIGVPYNWIKVYPKPKQSVKAVSLLG